MRQIRAMEGSRRETIRCMAEADEVVVRLSADEALVLFEWLHRGEDLDRPAPIEHRAEQVALRNFSALLESELVEPFKANYTALVDSARERLVVGR
jgi:hypothetical protein